MLYPVYVQVGDKKHAHGVVFPDFPGCFSAADHWEDLPAMIQEAVEAHFGGESELIPKPTPIEKLVKNPEYTGGVWMLVNIDLSKVNTKSIRLNVSLPENLVHKIDEAATAMHMTRSGFLASAAINALEHR
jgi:predicted RNase H-like HicB family nuclease